MARINIEESIHKDIRFDELSQKLGGKQNALGAITWAWIIAQSYWTQNKNGIPKTIWKQQKIREEIIEVGLARENGDFIYICGSEEQFKWLDGAIASGKASAAKRLGKVPNADPTPTQARPTSYSSSFSFSKEKKNTYAVDGIKNCVEEYQRTLDKFSIPSKASSRQVEIARLGAKFGFEDLRLAIIGMRAERRSDKFDPAEWLSLERLPKNFERFLNLGAKHERKTTPPMGLGEGTHRTDHAQPEIPPEGDLSAAPPELLELLRRTKRA